MGLEHVADMYQCTFSSPFYVEIQLISLGIVIDRFIKLSEL